MGRGADEVLRYGWDEKDMTDIRGQIYNVREDVISIQVIEWVTR